MRSGFGQVQQRTAVRPVEESPAPPVAVPNGREIPYDYVAKFLLEGTRGTRQAGRDQHQHRRRLHRHRDRVQLHPQAGAVSRRRRSRWAGRHVPGARQQRHVDRRHCRRDRRRAELTDRRGSHRHRAACGEHDRAVPSGLPVRDRLQVQHRRQRHRARAAEPADLQYRGAWARPTATARSVRSRSR